jgi:phosphoglycolate phosphatase
MNQQIKAVLFDFDGTLSNSLLPIHGIINQMRAERGAQARSAAEMLPLMSLVGEELVRDCLGDAARDGAEDLAEFRRRYVLAEPDATHLYPGAVAMLEALRQAGLRCAICSNKPHDLLMRFVEGTGIAPYFELVVGSGPVRKGKPDPETIHYILEKMAVDVDAAILVGDSEADAHAAQRAGLRFILVTFGYAAEPHENMPYRTKIDTLQSLPSLLTDL